MSGSKRTKPTREYDDLDDLFGSWSEVEFKDISARIEQGRQIDPRCGVEKSLDRY